MIFCKYSLVFFLAIFSVRLLGDVHVYPAPGGVDPSPKYKLEVFQNGKTKESFVYYTPSTHPNYPDLTTSFSTFDFDGEITVKVTSLDDMDISDCIIRPLHLGLKSIIKGNTITYKTSEPHMVSIELNGETRHSLLVFAHPHETSIPDKNDPSVVWFEPGVHSVGDYELPKGKRHIYFESGSYVKGRFEFKKDISISGRGIISGEDYPYETNIFRSLVNTAGKVSGITIINTPHYNLACKDAKFVKCISWYGQTDGVHIYENGIIESCFFKVNDDAFKLYNSGITVKNCVVWLLFTGAPFQLSWNLTGETKSDILVSNVDIIHSNWEVEHINRAVFNSVHGGGAHLKNYIFENIRIEGDVWRLVRLQSKRTRYGKSPVLGDIGNIVFRDVTVEGKVLHANILKGLQEGSHISKIENLNFVNLKIDGGYVVNSSQGGGWNVDPLTSNGLDFYVFEKKPESDYTSYSFLKPVPAGGFIKGNLFYDYLTENTNLSSSNTEILTVVGDGDWFKYAIKDIKRGTYNLSIKILGEPDGDDAFIQARMDEKPLGRVGISNNGFETNWRIVTIKGFVLSDKTDATLKILINTGGFDISSYHFEKVD